MFEQLVTEPPKRNSRKSSRAEHRRYSSRRPSGLYDPASNGASNGTSDGASNSDSNGASDGASHGDAAALVVAFARGGVPGSMPSGDVLALLGAIPLSEFVVVVAAQLDRRTLSAADAVALAALWNRLSSWVTARVDAAVVRVAGPAEVERADWGRDEAALALRLSPQAAAGRVEEARMRRGSLRRVGEALAAGVLLPGQADDAVSELGAAPAGVVDAVLDRVLPRAGGQTRAQFRRALVRALIAVDPPAAADRYEVAKQERGVWLRPLRDGIADVVMRMTAVEAVTVISALDAEASRAVAEAKASAAADPSLVHEVPRMGAARIDAVVGWAQRAWADPSLPRAQGRRTEIGITTTLETYLGVADDPAYLDRYGPVCAEVMRELMPEGTLRRLLTDDRSGELLDYGSRTYRPPQHLRDFVIARSPQCLLRGCTRPSRLCDLDHRVPFDDEGPTSEANLDPLCERHHIMKTTGGWQLLREPDGDLCWVSAAGVRYPIRRQPIDPSFDDPFALGPHGGIDLGEPPAAELLERATAHLHAWTAEQAKREKLRDLEPPF